MMEFIDPTTGEAFGFEAGGDTGVSEALRQEEENERVRDQMGHMEALWEGTKRSAENLYAGASDLAMDTGGKLLGSIIGMTGGDSDLAAEYFGEWQAEIDQDEAKEKERFAKVAKAYPVSSTVGQALPYLATAPLATGMGAAGVSALGAAEGFIGHEDNYLDRTKNAGFAAMGAGLGYGAGKLAHRVTSNIKGFTKGLEKSAGIKARIKLEGKSTGKLMGQYEGILKRDPIDMKAAMDDMIELTPVNKSGQFSKEIDFLDSQGFKITPAQKTGSATAINMENRLASNTMTAKPFLQIKEANQIKLNEVVGESIGLGKGVKELGIDALSEAEDRFQRKFARAALRAKKSEVLAGERQVLKTLANDGIEGVLPSPTVQKIAANLDNIIEKNNGLPKEIYIKQRSVLTKKTKDFMTQGKTVEADALREVTDILDDAFIRSNPKVAKGLKRTREQYANYSMMMKGQALTDAGNINVRTLSGNLRRGARSQYRAGKFRTDMQPETIKLYDTVRSLDRLKDVLPSSGTAERLSAQEFAPLKATGQLAGNMATKQYLKGNINIPQIQQIPFKQLFSTDTLGDGLMEAAAAGAGMGISQQE